MIRQAVALRADSAGRQAPPWRVSQVDHVLGLALSVM